MTSSGEELCSFSREHMAPGEMEHIVLPKRLLERAGDGKLTVSLAAERGGEGMTELTCIVCPKGCRLNVDEENGFLVTGYGCPRGKEYGHKELTAPTRTLTSIVRIEGAIHPCCPVKTSGEIPKRLIIQAMNLLKKVRLSAPVAAGAVVVQDICGTGVDWITTKNM